jgi:hypothetical protein
MKQHMKCNEHAYVAGHGGELGHPLGHRGGPHQGGGGVVDT